MVQREFAEWFNFWWEKGGNFTSPRVALVGDSITGGYYDAAKELLAEKGILADRFTCSHCVADPAFQATLALIFGEAQGYTYQAIHFNNGLHGGLNDTMYSLEEYTKGYQKCCELMRKLQPQAKLVLVTSTNMVKGGKPQDVPDDDFNRFILERNEFVRAYAKEQGYGLDDLYELSAWKPDFPHCDGVHFRSEVYRRLAEQVVRSVL